MVAKISCIGGYFVWLISCNNDIEKYADNSLVLKEASDALQAQNRKLI